MIDFPFMTAAHISTDVHLQVNFQNDEYFRCRMRIVDCNIQRNAEPIGKLYISDQMELLSDLITFNTWHQNKT